MRAVFLPISLMSLFLSATWMGCSDDGGAGSDEDAALVDGSLSDAEARPDGSAGDGSTVQDHGHVLYLNFSGAALDWDWADNATDNISVVSDNHVSTDIPPLDGDLVIDNDFPTRGEAIDEITRMVQQVFSPFDVQVVTRRPPSGNYSMVLIGGTMEDADDARIHVLGVCPLDCDDDNPNNVCFVASGRLSPLTWFPDSARMKIAQVIAHEAAHGYGLVHSDAGSPSIMNASAGLTLEWGNGGPVIAGEDGNWTCGRTTQDDYALLLDHMDGHVNRPVVPDPPDVTPPEVTSMSPPDGADVPPGHTACIDVSDPSGIQLVMLQILMLTPMGDWTLMATHSARQPPFEFPGMDINLDPTIDVRYRFTVIDRWDNLTERRVIVHMDSSAPDPPACP